MYNLHLLRSAVEPVSSRSMETFMQLRFVAVGYLLLPPTGLLAQSAVVPKTNPMKVYAHMMPWFQTPTTLGTNNWGYHWKFNTRNPNIINANGQREIASKIGR